MNNQKNTKSQISSVFLLFCGIYYNIYYAMLVSSDHIEYIFHFFQADGRLLHHPSGSALYGSRVQGFQTTSSQARTHGRGTLARR